MFGLSKEEKEQKEKILEHQEILAKEAFLKDMEYREARRKMDREIENQIERDNMLRKVAKERVISNIKNEIKEMGIEDFQLEVTTQPPHLHAIFFKEEDFNLFNLTSKLSKEIIMSHHIDKNGKITTGH